MTNEDKKPIIVAFVDDLMFSVKIGKVAESLGYRMEWIEKAQDVAPADPEAPEERPGELLHGQGGALFERLAHWQPALLIFDLGNEAIPWRQWLPSIKSSAATRRVPVICYGAHVDSEALSGARDLGADVVVARSRFSSAMPELIDEHARKSDLGALAKTCQEPLLDLARKGIDMFNEGQFYKCHDYLEEAWMADESPGRNLYRGILQAGIAYYQIERGNYRGALKMLLRVRQWLGPLPDVCRGVDVARLRQDVDNVHRAVLDLGPDRLGEIDRSLFRAIRLR